MQKRPAGRFSLVAIHSRIWLRGAGRPYVLFALHYVQTPLFSLKNRHLVLDLSTCRLPN
jgi:hypothetical protein